MSTPAPSDAQAALREAVAALQAQRAVLGDAVVDAALAPLLARLVTPSQVATTRPAPAPQLRLVSVLFLDIVGSTSLAQRLDPEQVHEVVDGALAAYTAVVQAAGGTVLQYAGDSLLAVFGHPRAAEDDAERAVRAALGLLAEARQQGAAVHRRLGHAGFDVRLGIHTGRVLLGAGVDAEHGIRGMTVNIAARLEQAAAPGTLLISHDTW
ncbi:MAG: adenylate/guanylate cyclase domain-containing protein, partial [Rubrivivax sp.]|nr:adenylate/guanylate cyclase domain-containing protein [Rubrivivax sp.]